MPVRCAAMVLSTVGLLGLSGVGSVAEAQLPPPMAAAEAVLDLERTARLLPFVFEENRRYGSRGRG